MQDKKIIIPGKPIPLKRPRLGRNKVYDSQSHIKEMLFWEVSSQLEKPNQLSHFKGPITLDMSFHMPIPKLSKKKRLALIGQPHIKRPDLDNLIKFYCDVCNVLLYRDDSQVYNIFATKTYELIPKTIIIVRQGERDG